MDAIDNARGAIRVLLADHHHIVRESLRVLLEAEPGFHVIGQAADGAEALKLASELKPDIFLLDRELWPYLPPEALRDFAKALPPVRTIVLAAEIDTDWVAEAFEFGVRGVVLMESPTQELIQSIYRVMAGEYWVLHESHASLAQFRRELGNHARGNGKCEDFGLTPRELEIVKAIAAAYRNRDIAEKFSIRERTVKNHIVHIFNKLGVSSRSEVALFAFRYHLADET